MSLAITSIALIPFGPATDHDFRPADALGIANLNIGLLILFAITSMGVYGVALAGWSSNSKYPLLGGLRSSAQMISYEAGADDVRRRRDPAGRHVQSERNRRARRGLSLGHSCRAGTDQLAAAASLGFFCYFIAAVAETNRVPFDLAEAESELVAGFHTEYSSFKFAMFFMAEYASMITVSCLATILFFGGWLSPFPRRACRLARTIFPRRPCSRRASGLDR